MAIINVENMLITLIQWDIHSPPYREEIQHRQECINHLSTHVVHVLKCPCALMYVCMSSYPKLRIDGHRATAGNGNMDFAIARQYREKNS